MVCLFLAGYHGIYHSCLCGHFNRLFFGIVSKLFKSVNNTHAANFSGDGLRFTNGVSMCSEWLTDSRILANILSVIKSSGSDILWLSVFSDGSVNSVLHIGRN